jgi:hypothetical protein
VRALSGGTYHLELRGDLAFDFQVTTETTAASEVTLHIHAEGAGAHTLEIRGSNLQLQEAGTQKIDLRPGHDIELVSHGRVVTTGTPWVVVVIPDGALSAHREVTGSSGTKE